MSAPKLHSARAPDLLFQGEYLEIVSSAHVRIYSFSQHRLIWFSLGDRYNRKRVRHKPRGGRAAGQYNSRAKLHPTPLPPTCRCIYFECSCMCLPSSATVFTRFLIALITHHFSVAIVIFCS